MSDSAQGPKAADKAKTKPSAGRKARGKATAAKSKAARQSKADAARKELVLDLGTFASQFCADHFYVHGRRVMAGGVPLGALVSIGNGNSTIRAVTWDDGQFGQSLQIGITFKDDSIVQALDEKLFAGMRQLGVYQSTGVSSNATLALKIQDGVMGGTVKVRLGPNKVENLRLNKLALLGAYDLATMPGGQRKRVHRIDWAGVAWNYSVKVEPKVWLMNGKLGLSWIVREFILEVPSLVMAEVASQLSIKAPIPVAAEPEVAEEEASQEEAEELAAAMDAEEEQED